MAKYTVSQDPLLVPDFSSLATAIAGVSAGDTIEIIDNAEYKENFPDNVNVGNIYFTSTETDPLLFPLVKFLNGNTIYRNWWNNNPGSRGFSNLLLKNFAISYHNNNDKSLTLNNCYIFKRIPPLF